MVKLAKVAGDPDQATVPVYWAVSVIVVTGTAPGRGTVTPGIAAISITVGAGVAGKTAVTLPVAGSYVTDDAPGILKELEERPSRVNPGLAVRVMVAV